MCPGENGGLPNSMDGWSTGRGRDNVCSEHGSIHTLRSQSQSAVRPISTELSFYIYRDIRQSIRGVVRAAEAREMGTEPSHGFVICTQHKYERKEKRIEKSWEKRKGSHGATLAAALTWVVNNRFGFYGFYRSVNMNPIASE